MATRPQHAGDLIVSSNFIRAAREAGYVSVSTALSELIDNALEAQASDISVSISRSASNGMPQIEVEDNGIGMNATELSDCLRFGGSSRFGGKESFGRFGMGLPSASLSQTRNIQVTAWMQDSAALTVSLDVDQIVAGQPVDLTPRPGAGGVTESGCRIAWQDCDRIEYQRLAWLERALHRDLGQIYRRFLNTQIRLTINGTVVEPIDPTLLTTELNGSSALLAFEPLKFEVAAGPLNTGFVTVRFSILPVSSWHSLDSVTKRRVGIVGHGGVSILRAGREVASGWHFMGGKRKENYDDWWRCEVEFDPILDEQFGITINKQGIRPSRALREALEPDLESIARMLNSRVRQSFEDAKFNSAAAKSCSIAESADADLPILQGNGKTTGPIRYEIRSAPLPLDLMFETSLSSQTLTIVLNVDHPGFSALYKPLQEMQEQRSSELRTAVELLIISYARATFQVGNSGDDVHRAWSTTYGRMLQRS
ncbi:MULTISPECIES: ATP-binding protein [unclassified Leucobacter]|uniref:ATP-binding protein n=1 Tax=unclassified Leucobacter TaxID=2621730 RepID=UPI00165D9E0A|nr:MULTISPECIES: ATP-binding protein [unclassified Leucobacter]MBC9937032.1 ATP-binding protein [Leucobacter sp. cx-87]